MEISKEQFQKIIRSRTFWGHVIRFFSTIGVALGIVWGYAEVYLDNKIDNRIELYEKEEEERNKPFREILAEQMDIPIQMVPYEIVWKLEKLDSLLVDVDEFSETILPHIEKEMKCIRPRLEIDPETGEEWWYGKDGRKYQVIYNDNTGKIWYHGQWIEIWR